MAAPHSIDALCQQARQAFAERNWEKARNAYQQALGLKSDVPDIHQGLATVCFQMRDLAGAAHHFKEVTRLDPRRAGAYINLGAVYNLLDQLDEALPVLRRGIQLDSHRAEGYYNLGLVYRRKGQTDLAIQAYREAIRVNPSMSDAHYNLANLYLEKQQFRQAIVHYKEALELRPSWEKAERGLAQTEAALAASESPAAPETGLPGPSANTPVPDSLQPQGLDPDRMVDPNVHGVLLTNLHKATIESETHGRQFLEILESEIEPAIKELSSCLLYPDSPVSELDQCVQKFESAIQNMRTAQRSLQNSIEKIRTIGDRLLKA